MLELFDLVWPYQLTVVVLLDSPVIVEVYFLVIVEWSFSDSLMI